MSPPVSVSAPRAVSAVRGVYGAGLLLAPARVLSAAARTPLDPAALSVARVLGARHLLQAALLCRRPSRRRLLVGAGVDGLHAASMAGLARWSRRPAHRALARHQVVTAAGFAVAGCTAAAIDV